MLNAFPDLFPYLISIVITLLLCGYAWRHREVRGSIAFIAFTLGNGIWTLFVILELTAPTVEAKLIWNTVEWLAVFASSLAWLAFVLSYSGLLMRTIRQIVMTAAVPVVVFILTAVAGNLYDDVGVRADAPLSTLTFAYTSPILLGATYADLLLITGLTLLVWQFMRKRGVYRRQIGYFLAGALLPVGSTIALLAINLPFLENFDLTVILFAVGNVIIAWGLFRFRLVDLVPIAQRQLLDSLTDAVMAVDNQNRIIDMNTRAAQMTLNGRRVNDVIGKPLSEALTNFTDDIASHIETTSSSGNFRVPLKLNERDIVINLQIKPLRNEQEQTIGRVFIGQDITERENLIMELSDMIIEASEAKMRYDDLVARLPVVVYQITRESGGTNRFSYVSPRLSEMNGIEPEDLQANYQLIYDRMHPEDLPSLRKAEKEARAAFTNFMWEGRMIINGETRWMYFESRPKLLSDGTIIWDGIEMDITERKQAEAARQKAERRYRMLSDLAFEGIILHEKGVAVDVNRAFCEMFGYSHEELIHQQMIPRLVAPQSQQTLYEQMQLPHATAYELMCVRKDGTQFPIEIESRQLEGDLRVASIRDITERKEAEKRHLELELERERSTLLGDFIQSAAHEFRTPLSNIRTSLYLMQRLEDRQKQAEKAKRIDGAVDDMTHLLEEMLTMMRLDRTKEIQHQILNINDVVNMAMENQSALIQRKQITVMRELDEGLPGVRGDSALLARAVRNIINNAAKYSQNQGQIWVHTTPEAQAVLVEIRDNGIGMTETEKARAYDQFYRADPAQTTRGFGLGLSIVRRVVDLHGGTLELESVVGQGTTLRMLLPSTPR